MPKPMINNKQSAALETNYLRMSTPEKSSNKLNTADKMKLDRLLRQPRSKEYMQAMKSLDAGGHVHNQNKVRGIIEAIKNEFPELELKGILLGYVSICYLGEPYEVHTLDMTGEIIEHYKKGQMLPGGLEKARGVALHGGYEFIEVYVDCCRAVSANGSVSVVMM